MDFFSNVNKHQQHQPPNVSNQKPLGPSPSDAALAAEELWLGTWRASGSILPKQIPCQGRPLAIRLRKHHQHKRYICHRPCNTKLEVFNWHKSLCQAFSLASCDILHVTCMSQQMWKQLWRRCPNVAPLRRTHLEGTCRRLGQCGLHRRFLELHQDRQTPNSGTWKNLETLKASFGTVEPKTTNKINKYRNMKYILSSILWSKNLNNKELLKQINEHVFKGDNCSLE